jgi:hypothetical protein
VSPGIDPSLDSGKDLEIYVGMPYEDARQALFDFYCEDISAHISYLHFSAGLYYMNCWFEFIKSGLEICGDKKYDEDMLIVTSLRICDSSELFSNKQEHWYSFDKLTVKDSRMKIEGLDEVKLYIGMDYPKAIEWIKKAKVYDIVVEDSQISYKTKYKIKAGHRDDLYYDYVVTVYVKSKSLENEPDVIESLHYNWEVDVITDDIVEKERHKSVDCAIIDLKYPIGLRDNNKLVE